MTEQPAASIARGFLFADLRGYSAFVERHGDQAGAELLRAYRNLVRTAIAEFDGAEIRTEGDSFYLVFGSPSNAVLCGLSILELASRTETASGHRISAGIGVHAGETVATEEGYVGSAVNIAARVCAAARPGELLVSDAVRSLTRTFLEVGFVPAGRRRLKGIEEPIALYRVVGSRTVAMQGPSRIYARWAAARWAALAAIVFLVIGLGVRAMLTGDILPGATPPIDARGSPSSVSSPDAVSTPSQSEVAFPNGAEQALRDRVDDAVARHCERPDADEIPVHTYEQAESTYSGPMAVEAGLRCTLGSVSEPDVVWYWKPTESWAADEYFFSMVGRRSAPPGDCATDDRAYQSWEFGQAEGKLLCLIGSRDAEIYWTHDDAQILGIAIRGDGDLRVLHRWWREHARTLGAAP